MAGKDPDDYRPRRAFSASDPSDAEAGSSPSTGDDQATKGSTRAAGSSGTASSGSASKGTSGKGTGSKGTSGKGTGSKGTAASGKSGSSASGGGSGVEPDRSTTILPRVRDDRSTTILPKTTERRRRAEEEDDQEADVRPLLRERTRLIVLVAGVAAVVILGLVLGYVVLGVNRPSAQPSAGVTIDPTTGESVTPTPVALLDDSSMINAQMARQIDPDRTWQVASTQRGLDSNSPRAACFPSDPVDGQPDPQQTIQRLLSSTGSDAPAMLHQAEAYGTPEDAAQAYVAISKALGSCTVVGAWIDSGRTITGLGDQSSGAIIIVTDSGKQTYHSMVISRTGRVVDIVDVAQPTSAADIGDTARALGEAITVQCTTSGGACAQDISVKSGPPPLGGDEPGFLAAGDLPPVGTTPSLWVGSTAAAPDKDYVGTDCETVDWTKVEATTKTMRTYTQQDSSSNFGVDQIIVTMSDDKAATDLVAKVKKDLDSCSDRKLTATVSKPHAISGRGAENNRVEGWSASVSHKTSSAAVNFRVGIVSVGPKVVWTLVNPEDKLDFTDDQWNTIVLRAGQRASQVE